MDRRTGELEVKPLQLRYRRKDADLLFHYATNKSRRRELEEKNDARFFHDEHGILVADVEGTLVRVETATVYDLLWEVFSQKTYAMSPEVPVVVWDVGMNVGIASLFFARHDHVRAIVGYEPFASTFDAAARNFALNPKLANKIHAVRGAVSDRNGFASAYCDDVRHASNSLEQTKRLHARETLERISLRSADEAFEEVRAIAGDEPIVCKMDVEGSEYAILRTLAKSGQLGNLGAVMLEYHRAGESEPLRLLHEAGFRTHVVPNRDPEFGIILACKDPLRTLFDESQ